MKHVRKTLVLMLLLALMVPLIGGAEERYAIAQVREQAQIGWRQTYHAHGRDIVVEIDLLVPEATTFPVITATSLHPSGQVPAQPLGQGKPHMQEGYAIRNTPRTFTHDRQDTAKAMKWPDNLRVFTRTIALHELDSGTAYALRNPYTVRDAQERIESISSQYFPGADLSFAPRRVTAGVDARPIHPTTGEAGEPWPDFVGTLSTAFSQVLRGIPVLGTVAQGFRTPAQNTTYFTPDLYNAALLRPAQTGTPQMDRVILNLLAESRVLAQDVPLVSVQHILCTYEALIASGRLRRVDSLQLGYIGWFSRSQPGTLTLLPCWVLEGLVYDSAEATGLLEGADYPMPDDHISQVLVCAQTGQLIDPWCTDDSRLYDLPVQRPNR